MISDEYIIHIPITHDIFSFLDDHIYVTKEDVIQFSRMEQIGAQTIATYMKYVINFITFYYGQLKSMLVIMCYFHFIGTFMISFWRMSVCIHGNHP